jgi:hypothetical protein
MALKWLLNLQLTHYRIANWVMEAMALDFDGLHAADAGELVAIPMLCLETLFLDLYCATAVLKLSQRSSPMHRKNLNVGP